jgi:hypothetical protein
LSATPVPRPHATLPMGCRAAPALAARVLPREQPPRRRPRPPGASSATRDRFPPETPAEPLAETVNAGEHNTVRKERMPMSRDFHPDLLLAARQPLWARKTRMRVEKADQNGNGRAVRWTPTRSAAPATEWTSAVHCRPSRAPALQCRDRTPFPPETPAEPLTNALTPPAPHTARTRQTSMNTTLLPDPTLAAHPHLSSQKPPIAIEKTEKNGNARRARHTPAPIRSGFPQAPTWPQPLLAVTPLRPGLPVGLQPTSPCPPQLSPSKAPPHPGLPVGLEPTSPCLPQLPPSRARSRSRITRTASAYVPLPTTSPAVCGVPLPSREER